MPKVWSKNALFGYFWARVLKTVVIIEINTLTSFKLESFAENQKCLNLGAKMPYLVFFGLEF